MQQPAIPPNLALSPSIRKFVDLTPLNTLPYLRIEALSNQTAQSDRWI
jgi:hypothetical protein